MKTSGEKKIGVKSGKMVKWKGRRNAIEGNQIDNWPVVPSIIATSLFDP